MEFVFTTTVQVYI